MNKEFCAPVQTMQDLLRVLVCNAMHGVAKETAVEKFLEVSVVQMQMNGSSDFIGAVGQVREKLSALALSVDESLYWLVCDYYGFRNRPLLCGFHLADLNVLLSFVRAGIASKSMRNF